MNSKDLVYQILFLDGEIQRLESEKSELLDHIHGLMSRVEKLTFQVETLLEGHTQKDLENSAGNKLLGVFFSG